MTEKRKYYPELNAKISFPKMEEEILKFWEEDNTFEKSVKNRAKAEEFVFYDGPPFANGTPHYGHIMVSYVKDAVARFQTMNGKKVERRLGWDCHGLPAEMSAEKQLGVSGRKQIEEFGVEKFNDFCRTDVLKYSNIWVDMFKRIGRWVDFNNDYKTMNLSFMESVISNFKQLYDKGLVYEDYRVLPYSWAAETPLSNFEVNQGYQDKTDNAITVMFKLENGQNILVWTTTPWTLPSNLMLAVNKDIDYVVMSEGEQEYIIAEARLGSYKKQLENATLVKKLKGSDLIGLSYEPMFKYFGELKNKGAFKVLNGEFVSTEDGTGVVHIAPGFGQDDFEACRAYDENFPVVCPVDESGKFTAEVSDYQGIQVFETNEPIMQWLKANGLLVKKEQYTHSYPFCWRTDTPLMYKAMSSWFVKVTDFRDDMVKNNQEINWIPGHIKDGRFGKWLEGARDWSISRNRFWGTPIPVWKSENPKFPRIDVFGSIAEIKEKTGIEVQNLHKPYIDDVVYPNPDDPTGQTMMRRVSDVFDCWFESGSMPYAQVHYPFENKEWFEEHFPADFIVEAMDQTRGWFYTLTVLSTALHNRPAFKNCICTGLLMAEGGQKLSKRLKNYPDPNDVLNSVGSDALRWFLISSPVLKGGNLAVDKEGKEIAKAARKALIPFWNAYYFFTLYANAEGIEAKEISQSLDVLDAYILAKLKAMVNSVKSYMQDYEIARATAEVEEFLEILNNWYIRRSRSRFWSGEDLSAFNTLYTVLVNVAKITAPLMPFMSEFAYRGLKGGVSVHLADTPNLDAIEDNKELIKQMDMVRAISSVAKSIREEHKLRNRLPLKSMIVAGDNTEGLKDFIESLKDEVNVKEVVLESQIDDVASRFLYLKTPLIGKRLGAYMKDIMAKSKTNEWMQNEDGTLSIAEQTLLAEEYELRLVIKEGKSGLALPDNTAVVILDTEIDENLEKEGIARDFVRMIQALRKTKDFDITDRIELEYNSSNVIVKSAIREYAEYIKEQVLALNIIENPNICDASVEDLGGDKVNFDVRKVA
ncbi:MAG: isoleucine--tRNA ligase [Alphaproteobacteria bacterium]|nr:isoleucine--tRNA ligase [Alphaproteobacteria bacterium]